MGWLEDEQERLERSRLQQARDEAARRAAVEQAERDRHMVAPEIQGFVEQALTLGLPLKELKVRSQRYPPPRGGDSAGSSNHYLRTVKWETRGLLTWWNGRRRTVSAGYVEADVETNLAAWHVFDFGRLRSQRQEELFRSYGVQFPRTTGLAIGRDGRAYGHIRTLGSGPRRGESPSEFLERLRQLGTWEHLEAWTPVSLDVCGVVEYHTYWNEADSHIYNYFSLRCLLALYLEKRETLDSSARECEMKRPPWLR